MWIPSIADSACSFWHMSTVCIRKAFRGGTGKTLDDCMQKKWTNKIVIKILRKFGSLEQQKDVPCRQKRETENSRVSCNYKDTTQETQEGLTGYGNTLFIFTHELKGTRVTWVSQKNGNERCRPTQISYNLRALLCMEVEKMMVLGP